MKKPSIELNPFLNLIKRKAFFLFSFFFFLLSISSFSQDSTKGVVKNSADTLHKVSSKKYSPHTAMLLSVVVPGLGQAYNKKYWKMPIVYAAIGIPIYFFIQNNIQYRHYKQAYINRDTAQAFNYYYSSNDATKYDLNGLQLEEQRYHKSRDLNVLLITLFYSLQIADAYVDAHLKTFDISDNLSMNIHPSLNYSALNNKPSAGLVLSFKF